MELHGRSLAQTHTVSSANMPDQLLARLANNEQVLLRACSSLTAALQQDRQLTPAAEWLLDNFYLIEEQIRTAKRHLPKGYSKELPRLQKGPTAGQPRVYDIALETISHGDGRVDPENLRRFIAAYQQVTPLRVGELWAIPIMLRLALIENLRRVAARLIASRESRNLADTWADQMTEIADKDPGSLILTVADMARSEPPLDSAFVAELTRRLRGQTPALTLALTWVSQHLAESGATIEQLVQQEVQQQAADQVSVSNSIGSLRFLGAMDWREFVENMSVVEAILHNDVGNVYAQMDFATRDHYRHVIEKVAKRSPLSEPEIASEAITLARQAAAAGGAADRRAHVGYYLIDDGLPELEQRAQVRPQGFGAAKRAAARTPLRLYLGAMLLISVSIAALLLSIGWQQDLAPWLLALLAIPAVVAGSHLALALVNWIITMLAAPRPLAKMDFKAGIPAAFPTLVVVPTLLTSLSNIEDLAEALEVRFLANRDAQLRFCLLTDFADAVTEHADGDAALVTHACSIIEQLNRTYAGTSAGPFLLLHRPRKWNPVEDVWMGYERKRGKLTDLNRLMRGGPTNVFSAIVGDIGALQAMRYVITLDTDTQLPRDAARQFVAAMAHPLNHPVFDPAARRITHGYGILQPRVATSLPAVDASFYELLCGGEAGIDPYTRAVSDVYQDIFGEGSFVGKGIYDIDAFEVAFAGRFPENRILSHDLIEGCYARSGLLSDVMLFEQYPARYETDVARRHRWIRGDWQLASWLLPSVPAADPFDAAGKRRSWSSRLRNPLSALSRWKLFDNLRRSVVPALLVALFVAGWLLLADPAAWTVVLVAIVLFTAISASLLDLLRKPEDVLLRQHLRSALRGAGRHLAHAFLTLTFLPYEAFFSLDAIIRTNWRLLVSHRMLLEWKASGQTTKGAVLDTDEIAGAAVDRTAERAAAVMRSAAADTLGSQMRIMWFSPALALVVTAALALLHPYGLVSATPLLLVWLLAPVVAWWISKPAQRDTATLTDSQRDYLHRLTRKTWSFFETYVGPEDNWLPPDNVQEHPVAVVARRTSPTNIGLSLLANLAAHDFGYMPTGQLLERTGNTLRTMAALERHQGHFYNWYDTQYLKPLLPIYISMVDSGNLAAHLMTLRPGLLELVDAPIVPVRLWHGIDDTLRVLLEHRTHGGAAVKAALPEAQATANTETLPASLSAFGNALATVLAQPPTSLQPALAALDLLGTRAQAYVATLSVVPETTHNWWARALSRQCAEARQELLLLAPWLEQPQLQAAAASLFARIPTLLEVARRDGATLADPDAEPALAAALDAASSRAIERIRLIEALAVQANDFARMEYGFLYDPATHLLAIGYNLSERRLDQSYYDLLASEARLGSFVAIAQGQIPQDNWFALGRQLTVAGGDPILLSWSGSMFEYLMPLLVMPNYPNTLLDQTYKAAVERQIDYGAQRSVPWGISESGYNAFDASLNYQYRAFGVPGLGLKRGLGDDLVVAPYASMMALMVASQAACANLMRQSAEGFEGRFGMYEAIDYTSSRQPRGQSHALIRSYMVHHQGMGFLALAYLLLGQPMQRRFASDPLLQSAMLLLQERIPKPTAAYANTSELADIRSVTSETAMPMRIINRADTRTPEIQLLSNGRYHVMVTSAGGSYSRWRDLAVSRWREDATRDNWGAFCYVRDVADGKYWSTAFQPTLVQPKHYEVIFSEGRAEYRRTDNELEMHTEIVVSPEDDIELRRTKITNRSRVRRTVDFTSYTEVVMAAPAADDAHPAFSNLFVQTEILRAQPAILCTRRPRSLHEKSPWMFHLMALHGAAGDNAAASFETDRMQFIGRGNTPRAPQAMQQSTLSNSAGSVLDPIASIRQQITLEPEQSVVIDIVTGMADTREASIGLIQKFHDRHLADRVFELAWTHSQVVLRQLNASEADAQLYSRLANSIIYANAQLRADASVLVKNHRGQSGLWSYAISGDLPIVLLQIKDSANIELVRQMVQAHAYWRLKGLAVDLVIWNEDHAGYRQVLQEQIMGLIASGIDAQVIDRPGGIFVRLAEQVANEDRILLQSVARAILSDAAGTLAEQSGRRGAVDVRLPTLVPSRTVATTAVAPAISSALTALTAGTPMQDALILTNDFGGFAADGREYVITTSAGQRTPAPWSNVLANANFGTVISESGQAYTWGENAHEFRLTPWNNDPVSDAGGEAFYLRDEDSGRYWSPTPLPRRGAGSYRTRHGFGYSVFEHNEDGISSELWVYVALDASVKFSVLKVRNDGTAARRMSATGYVEWVMGDMRPKTGMHVITEADPLTGALFAKNAYNTEFPERIGFFYVDAAALTLTGDRSEFIGRNGSLESPAAMARTRLSGRLGAGLDPCAAIQVPFDLAEGQQREIVFILGVAGRRSADVSSIIQRFRGVDAARNALADVNAYWSETLGAVQVETPDAAVNALANGWLMYQTIACRLWARSGYYQSGGAFGFRDQLQDVMAMVHAKPGLVREHLLLCAAHQFEEGDVQHWWHPPSDRGVRTKCSDDYLWLPLAVHRYVTTTGDTGVLGERAPYLTGRELRQDEDSYYDLPTRSDQVGTLYEHSVRAIERGLRFGAHGLPLIGSCDWNDGMDKVGEEGRGESVWLGFFLFDVLTHFAQIARLQRDDAFEARCIEQAGTLQRNIETNGWDGGWYRRAYFDDGTPLGSASNPECQIDSISQSWAVLSGAGNAERTQIAMRAVDARLVRRDHALIQLLDPPFDKSDLNPGYIRGYVPGVRENGGQYTHAAVWTAMAFARLGDSARAWELLGMINPINHGRSAADVATYRVEPYVVAADVYGVAPHVGRGGWTWYTGSSGWMYRLILESLLGLRLEIERLYFAPCLPAAWPQFSLTYRFRTSCYRITVLQTSASVGDSGKAGITVDGIVFDGDHVPLVDDGVEHRVEVRIMSQALP
ncbi:MAG: cyclic beta 1-2 glucan synthetase [Herminiimonas sp.]|nr:cyclic beta 1-2 glucan synthetase [Herminiimonas sp.]